jgi:hypothetical protein
MAVTARPSRCGGAASADRARPEIAAIVLALAACGARPAPPPSWIELDAARGSDRHEVCSKPSSPTASARHMPRKPRGTPRTAMRYA